LDRNVFTFRPTYYAADPRWLVGAGRTDRAHDPPHMGPLVEAVDVELDPQQARAEVCCNSVRKREPAGAPHTTPVSTDW
jgi:hypothetical protein